MNENDFITSVRSIVYQRFGLVFSELQTSSLIKSVHTAASKFKIEKKPEEVLKWLELSAANQEAMDELARHLTIGETYFFRERAAIDLLRDQLIPDFRRQDGKDRTFRIWSAGCSSGEEPYTLAIVLSEAMKLSGPFKFEILATDINPNALEKARIGRYSDWSFRETSTDYKEKYFTYKDKLFEISEDIKKLVHFRKFNLKTFADSNELIFSHPFDAIFCRNVLMYFDVPVIRKIGNAFYRNLNENGWLIASQVELNDDFFPDFQKKAFCNGFFYRKQTDFQKDTIQPDVKNHFAIQKKNVFSKSRSTVIRAGIETNRLSKNKDSAVKAPSFRIKLDSKPEKIVSKRLTDTSVSKEIIDSVTSDEILSLANSGSFDQALKLSNDILSKEPENTSIRFIQALILIESGLTAAAESVLTQLLYLDPHHLAAQYSLAGLLKKAGKDKQSKKQIGNLINELEKYDDESIIQGLEGMTAGRMRDLIKTMA